MTVIHVSSGQDRKFDIKNTVADIYAAQALFIAYSGKAAARSLMELNSSQGPK